ncbi:MAG: hypothetical protein ABSG57_04805 [Candidatus Bathyarchaeia archaeon]
MNLYLTLDEEGTKRFQAVKKHTGMKANKNVMAYLIYKEYRRTQTGHRLFLGSESYAMVEKAAEAKGESIEEFVENLIESEIKKAEEGEKHEN